MNTHSSQHQRNDLSATKITYGHTLHMGTLLLVEDSRLASDAIRLMFRGAGGRLRRTDTLAGGLRHLDLYTPDAAIIDLGLPDGSGLDLIALMAVRRPRVPLIVGTSGQADMAGAALAAGADVFLPKPIESVTLFRNTLGCVFHPLRHFHDDSFAPLPDTAALRDDMYLAHDLLCGARSPQQRAYALQFAETLAQVLGDPTLRDAVQNAQDSGATTLLAARIGAYLRAQPLV
jgi:CheY-like chemotaxis protein